MDHDNPSSASSDLSDPPSSPLSCLSRSPSISPRSSLAYTSHSMPSPPSSAVCSGSASPSKSSEAEDLSILVNPEGPRPAKRRKLNAKRERTTQRINLEKGASDAEQDELTSPLTELISALRHKKKIVVIAGAGISVSSGIPDFRSSRGLFASLKNQHKLKASGAQLFDASVYKSDESTTHFHTMVRELAALTEKAKPSRFHDLLASLAHEGRLLRLYTQNIDGLDTSLEPLATTVPLNEKGPWKKTVQLHGGLGKMVCSKCSDVSDFDPSLFNGPEAPLCKGCEALDLVRTSHAGKRSHGIGKLRPRMVLYNEHNPDEQAIANVVRADLRARPDAVIVVGTSLKIPGVKNMVKDMCGVTRKRKDGITVWINRDPEPSSGELKDCWDLVVKGKSDDVASLVGLPRWNETVHEDFTVVDAATVETNMRSGKFNVEIRRSTPKESASVKADSPKPQVVEAEPVRKTVVEVKGIPTPTASPKVRPRTALPTARPKQSQLSFGKPQPNSKTTPAQTKEVKRKKKQSTTKVEKKPRATVTNAFKATKATVAATTKLSTKNGKDHAESKASPIRTSMEQDLQLRFPTKTNGTLDSKPMVSTTSEQESTVSIVPPTTPTQTPSDSSQDNMSPLSIPRGMAHLLSESAA